MRVLDRSGRVAELDGLPRSFDDAQVDAVRDAVILRLLRAGMSYRAVGRVVGLTGAGAHARVKKLTPRERERLERVAL